MKSFFYTTRSTLSLNFRSPVLAHPPHVKHFAAIINVKKPRNTPPRMKRKAVDVVASQPKKAKEGDYCDVPTVKDEHGAAVWPAPNDQIDAARAFLRDCAASGKKTLIVPDKDADGLSAGVIIHRTLVALGLDPNLIHVHLVQKGSNVHESFERRAMASTEAEYVIVLDQGSRGGPPIVDRPSTKCLLIDHHFSNEFPESAVVVSGCHCPPVPTSALMVFEICKVLHESIPSTCDLYCAIGTHGDLGNTLKWLPPFPDMTQTFKTYSKKTINDCVSYINAPRRTGTYDVLTAWSALLNSKDPKQILSNGRLAAARQEINDEVEKRTHTPPKFSKDGKIAVLKISSEAQVHPVIATRWASHLKSKALEIVMVANYGYLPNRVNFSCRIATCARQNDPPVNIIETLKSIAALDDGDLVTRLGESFARGHKEASGGIVGVSEFEELYALMKVGEKPDKPPGQPEKRGITPSPQKNTLANYFKKA